MSAVSVDVIAKLLDVTPRRVQQLAKEGVIPKPKHRGEYEIAPCVINYVRYLNRLLDGEAGDLTIEKTRLTRAQAEKAEIEAARLKGELVSLADAERGWSALIGAFRAKALTIPPLAAMTVLNKTEKEVEQILTRMVYEALAELSNWKPDEDADFGLVQGSEDSSAPATNDDQSVGQREDVSIV
jgi:phage terminase Nu1 subunit (DNA packaging protein)